MTGKLWTSAALTPFGSEYGGIAVVAETREDAIAKAHAALSQPDRYVPYQQYKGNLCANLHAMMEVTNGVLVDWDAARGRLR